VNAPLRQLRPGLWHWRTAHPDWSPDEPWGEHVSSYALADGDRLLLFDPLGVPVELEALARERTPAIVLTSPWHERDTRALVERLGAALFTPAPDTADDLMRKFGITAEQAGAGSPDLVGSGPASATCASPVELVLPAHGERAGRDALERALA
jgi:hypothetical protein